MSKALQASRHTELGYMAVILCICGTDCKILQKTVRRDASCGGKLWQYFLFSTLFSRHYYVLLTFCWKLEILWSPSYELYHFFEVWKNTWLFKNGSRNSHSRKCCVHTHTCRIVLQNTFETLNTHTPQVCGTLQFKNQFISSPLFKLMFSVFFFSVILIFSVYSSAQFGNSSFGRIFVLLTCFSIWLLIHKSTIKYTVLELYLS